MVKCNKNMELKYIPAYISDLVQFSPPHQKKKRKKGKRILQACKSPYLARDPEKVWIWSKANISQCGLATNLHHYHPVSIKVFCYSLIQVLYCITLPFFPIGNKALWSWICMWLNTLIKKDRLLRTAVANSWMEMWKDWSIFHMEWLTAKITAKHSFQAAAVKTALD